MTQNIEQAAKPTVHGFVEMNGEKVQVQDFVDELQGLMHSMHMVQSAMHGVSGETESCYHLSGQILDRATALLRAVGTES